MPPGERMPLHVGISSPRSSTRRHQPRNSELLAPEPVRQSTTQIRPAASNFDPKAYSW